MDLFPLRFRNVQQSFTPTESYTYNPPREPQAKVTRLRFLFSLTHVKAEFTSGVTL
ncbi:MAG TPA: hypothetical protein VN673_05235 [Clostridia bacterium]|nr:hypothetical protein [Clostridia bacterium]